MLLKDYIREIQNILSAGNATEHSYRPALKSFIESLDPKVTATNDPKHVECGAPDYVLSFTTKHGPLTIGNIETKNIGTNLDEAKRSDQMKRYLAAIPNLILTDYLEFRWYVDGKFRLASRLARVSKNHKLLQDTQGSEITLEILNAFISHKPQQVSNPKELAVRMAALTHLIRDIIVNAFQKDKASALLKDLHKAFEITLIPELEIPQFADMFAQTLAYGLFAARCNHKGREPFKRVGAASEIPKTNPFLRKLFDIITGAALDDEPYATFVNDLAQLLANSDMPAILADFGKRTRKQDPIIHFYETFLAAYDWKLRKKRGVFFTPEPVVSYIVRSVDYLLRTRFRCPDGLADTATIAYKWKDDDGKQHTETSPKVLILDPACGTGTFLYAIVDLIREAFMQRNDAGMWSGYVRNHLLPRLFGFELLMAPYAVAHFKLGMQLAAQDMTEAQRKIWAYDFAGDERLGIYLTNSLEEAERKTEELFGPFRIITEEANAASKIKRDMPIMVVLGNPPYSNYGMMNKGRWILDLLKDYKKNLHEKKINIDDDFIKFLRFGQWRIEQSGAGILAFITNNTYIDGITHRRMRESLINAFTDIYVLDLHGSAIKKEAAPDGSKDENVFDITVGVAITLFVKEPGKTGCPVYYADLWGDRESKHNTLWETDVAKASWKKLKPRSPYFFFTDINLTREEEYVSGWSIKEVLVEQNTGIQTKRDQLTIRFSKDDLKSSLEDIVKLTGEELRQKYGLPEDGRDWAIEWARADVVEHGVDENRLRRILYRPFDWRYTYFSGKTKGFLAYPRRETMLHMIRGANLGFITLRINGAGDDFVAICTRDLVEKGSLPRGNYSIFPLYLYSDAEDGLYLRSTAIEMVKRKYEMAEQNRLADLIRRLFPEKLPRWPNLHPDFIVEFENRLRLKFVPNRAGDLRGTFGPEDVFHYVYALLHSPAYRARYAEFLKIDFPRVSITSNLALFQSLVELGERLVSLHLMESPALRNSVTIYPVNGDHLVETGYPRYLAPGQPNPETSKPLEKGRVYISKDNPKKGKKGQYFEGVTLEVWEFHIGGYQVCEKWLKDRRGRNLFFEDLTHYQQIVVALEETIRIMQEIDEAIPSWPLK